MLGKASELKIKILVSDTGEAVSESVNQYLRLLGDKDVISIDTEIALAASISASNGYGRESISWKQVKCTIIHKK